MTPKEKAQQLIDSMFIAKEAKGTSWETKLAKEAKQCALVAVDEIIYLGVEWSEPHEIHEGTKIYWELVKEEIENYEL